jgi:hypothetical protein
MTVTSYVTRVDRIALAIGFGTRAASHWTLRRHHRGAEPRMTMYHVNKPPA